MPRIKMTFTNDAGLQLAGLLEVPESSQPIEQYAIFAHCFTCGKDIAAASRISRALARQGIAVLRFDFTGLGNSDGDFANTNFSSNVQDLLAAARALETDYRAPSLLIGHSLGGAAVLSASTQLSSVRAVATIGAPATADHVQQLFVDATQQIQHQGEATVQIGARRFNIKKQLLDDLKQHASADTIQHMRKALMIFHSPIDEIVSVDEAAKIYQAAHHPKSFVSLDKADHLLSDRQDADYVANVVAAWAGRYLETRQADNDRSYGSAPNVESGQVLVTELDKKFLRGMYSDRHQLMADEPVSYGGSNLGPSPYDLLLMALGACTSMTLRLYANHKKLDVRDISVRLQHEKVHAEDCEHCLDSGGKLDKLSRFIHIDGDISDEQRQRLIEIADKCPVHKTLQSRPLISTVEE